MNAIKQRLEYVDVMRGIAITLVVAGHLLQFNGVPTSNPTFEFIYSFHMPLFFAISGYITSKVTKVDSWQSLLAYCRKKTISIALPFVTWTLFIGPFVLRESWNTLSVSQMTNMLLHSGLWFLKTLYLVLLIYGVFCYMWSKRQAHSFLRYASWFYLVLFSLIVIMLGIEEKNFLLYSFAFYLGVLLSLDKRIYAVATSSVTYALSVILFFLLATHWNFSGGGNR